MAIHPLALKVLGGAAVISVGGTGIFLTYEHKKNATTLFDKKLLEYLDKDKHDIVFSVYDGDTTSSTITSNFATFSEATPKVATITLEIKTDNSDNPLKGTDAANFLNSLKKMEGESTESQKTWKCKISFDKKASTASELEEKLKETLVKDAKPFGFFNKLQKDTTSASDVTEDKDKAAIKNFKKKMVSYCAYERFSRNKATNKKTGAITSEDLLSTKTFELMDNTETTKKLIVKDKRDFDSWFS